MDEILGIGILLIFVAIWVLMSFRDYEKNSERGGKEEGKSHREEREAQNQQSDNEGDGRKQESKATTFLCVGCRATLRVKITSEAKRTRCPSCKTEYEIISQRGETPVLLVIPVLKDERTRESKEKRRKPAITPEVRAAFRALDLYESATFADVKRAYRESILRYHPDKVAHLGPKLREVAEAESKELNRNYDILERHFRNL